MELGKCLCEVRAGQYWRLENLKSFNEFLARRFPKSRRKAYYLMSIHEHLPRGEKGSQGSWLDEGSRTGEAGTQAGATVQKCNLVAQRPYDVEGGFQMGSGERATGKDSEPSELIYFKVYKARCRSSSRQLKPRR